MNKVKVICHMYTSIDGKIITDIKGFPDNDDCVIAGDIYDNITFGYKAWGCGRTTFEYLSDDSLDLSKYEEKKGKLEDKIIKDDTYCIAFDRKGKLKFSNPYNDYANHQSRIISVFTEQVDRRLLTYFDEVGISYMFCGKEDLDLNLFLAKLANLGIDTFMLCGGAEINAAFMKQDLIDEISLVICPGIQGGRQEVTFVGSNDISSFPKYFKAKEAKILEGNTIYLKYTK